MRLSLLIIVLFPLCACATLPDVPLPAVETDASAEFPGFVPMRRVALEQSRAQERTDETEESLEARVAGLRSRAEQLRSAELD